MVGEGKGLEGMEWYGVGWGRKCYLSTNVISFCFYTCTNAHAHLKVSVPVEINLPIPSGPDGYGRKQPRKENVINVTS